MAGEHTLRGRPIYTPMARPIYSTADDGLPQPSSGVTAILLSDGWHTVEQGTLSTHPVFIDWVMFREPLLDGRVDEVICRWSGVQAVRGTVNPTPSTLQQDIDEGLRRLHVVLDETDDELTEDPWTELQAALRDAIHLLERVRGGQS